ncbi:hypothetical protein M3Y97_00539700 [Aphelenchoides bicaudatus]|nr:hypothetical protein M3Y97_00539700 [Aphelenchoides bicaudatus]
MGITPFEILLHTLAVWISSILVVLRWGFEMRFITFWQLFTPLFVASALNVYFIFIVTLRHFIEDKQLKRAVFQNAFNFLRASVIGFFEVLICQKIEGDFERGQVAIQSSYSVVFMPVWLLMAALGIQACRLL